MFNSRNLWGFSSQTLRLWVLSQADTIISRMSVLVKTWAICSVWSAQYQNWKWSIHYVFTSSSSFFLTIWNKRPVPTVNGWIEHSSVNVFLSVFWPLSSNGLLLDKIWKKRQFSGQNMLLLIRNKLTKVTILTGNVLEWIELSILLLLIRQYNFQCYSTD